MNLVLCTKKQQLAMSYIPDAVDVSARLSKLGLDLLCFLASLSAYQSVCL